MTNATGRLIGRVLVLRIVFSRGFACAFQLLPSHWGSILIRVTNELGFGLGLGLRFRIKLANGMGAGFAAAALATKDKYEHHYNGGDRERDEDDDEKNTNTQPAGLELVDVNTDIGQDDFGLEGLERWPFQLILSGRVGMVDEL